MASTRGGMTDRSRSPRGQRGVDVPEDKVSVLTPRPYVNTEFLSDLIMTKEFNNLKWGDVPYAEIFHMMLKNPSDGDEWRESSLALACDKRLRLIPANYSTVCRPVMSMPKLIRYAALTGQPHIGST